MSKEIKPKPVDYVYALAKGSLGAVPIFGAPASELLALIIASPLEKRKTKYLTDLGVRLNELIEKKPITLEDLSNNDQFIDVVSQATAFALKTSEKEKITLFQNVILNAAINEVPEQTICHIFLNLLDSFTIWHIKILHFINNPKDWFDKNSKAKPAYLMTSLSKILKSAFPEMQEKDELLNLIWRDLKNAGFHDTADLKSSLGGDGALANRTTKLGQEFLQFISTGE